MNSETSLYNFHKQLRADLEFAPDQPILFKALDAEGVVVARYALVDLGSGTVDQVSLSKTIKEGVTSFVYFYDVVSKKSVNITLEGEEIGSEQGVSLIEAKGPNPVEFENGYVAFEDLPEEKRHLPGERCHCGSEDCDGSCEDDDFDDADDEDEDSDGEDKEEEELIYAEEE